MTISDNENLYSLEGLQNLQDLKGQLLVTDNSNLRDISALSEVNIEASDDNDDAPIFVAFGNNIDPELCPTDANTDAISEFCLENQSESAVGQ